MESKKCRHICYNASIGYLSQPFSLSKTKGTNGKLTRNKIGSEIRHQQDTYCKSFYNQKYSKTKKGHIMGHSFVSHHYFMSICFFFGFQFAVSTRSVYLYIIISVYHLLSYSVSWLLTYLEYHLILVLCTAPVDPTCWKLDKKVTKKRNKSLRVLDCLEMLDLSLTIE